MVDPVTLLNQRIQQLEIELSDARAACAATKTARELALEDLLSSARCIAEREGAGTDWERFARRIASFGISGVTAKVFITPLPDERAEDASAPQPLAPHQNRVVEEKIALDEKRTSLAQFFYSPIFTSMNYAEQELLRQQSAAMALYSWILGQRIDSFYAAGFAPEEVSQ